MNSGLSLTEAPTRKTVVVFLVLSCLGILFVFRGSIWGDRILSPLDIATTFYTKYQWIDPGAGHIPRNHYVIDMVDYELARLYVAHRALQSGEFPWWDPHSDGGGPLAAETHYSATNPVRLLLFRLLPFVSAYNWTRILESFLGGLGMFLLLRFLGFAQFTTVLGALSFQFAGIQASFYYSIPPHSLPYYPFLWLVLAKYTRARPLFAIGLGGLLCAAMIMAGTQQSHAYVVLFLLCFMVAYGSSFRGNIMSIVLVVAGVFVLGCALAAPVLIPQIEIFRLSSRELQFESSPISLLTGVFSLTGVFPWFTGSFRTLELSKVFVPNQPAMAYVLYIGTPAIILAIVGILAGWKPRWWANPNIRMAVLLIALYFIAVCSTPLLNVLYNRTSMLAVLGLIVMCAAGWELLLKGAWSGAGRVIRWLVLLLAIGVVAIHAFSFGVYPRIKQKILDVVLKREANNPSMPSLPELRRFQVDNLPNEITFRNPEPLLAFLGALCLLGLVVTQPRYRGAFVAGVFAFNLLPLLIFSSRGMPSSPISYWNALLAGGPEQRAIIEVLGRDLRLKETAPGRLDYVFPGTMAGLYGVHSLHGYVALRPQAAVQAEHARGYNVLYESESRRQQGKVTVLQTNQVRFVWSNKQEREVKIIKETPNTIHLRIGPGPPGELVRTDTYYPGWRIDSPKGIAQHQNGDGFLALSIPGEPLDLVLRYMPSHHGLTMPTCIVSLVIAVLLLLFGRQRALITRTDATAATKLSEALPR